MAYDGKIEFDVNIDLKKVEKGLQQLGNVFKSMNVDTVIDKGLGKLGLTFDEITSAVGAAADAYSVVSGAMKFVTSAAGALSSANIVATGTTKMQEAAQKGLNTTMNANVILAVVSALITFISAIATAAQGTTTAGEQIESECDKMIEATDKLGESAAQSAVDYQTNLGKIAAEAGTVEGLIGRLEELRGKTDATAAEQQEMANITEQLTEKIPGLSAMVDENTGILAGNADAWRQMADAHYALEELNARIERTNELLIEKEAAEAGQIAMTQQLLGLERKKSDLYREEMNLIGQLGQLESEKTMGLYEMGDASDHYYNRLAELNGKLDDNSTEQRKVNSSIEEYKGKLEELPESIQEAIDAHDAQAEATRIYAQQELDGLKSKIDAKQALTQQDIDMMYMAMDAGAVWTEGHKEQCMNYVADEQMRLNRVKLAQEEQIKAVEDGRVKLEESDMRAIEKKRENGILLDELEQAKYDKWIEMQLQAVAEQEAIIDEAAAAELEKRRANGDTLNEVEQARLDRFKEKRQEFVDAANNTNNEIIVSDQKSLEERTRISNENNKATQEMVDNMEFARQELPQFAKYVDQMTMDEAKILQDAKATWNEGGKEQLEAYFQSLEEGYEIGDGMLEGKAQEVGQTANESFAEEVSPEKGKEATTQYVEGGVDGLNANAPNLATAATNAGQGAQDAAMAQAQSSGWFNTGAFIVNGVIRGVHANTGNLASACRQMVSQALAAAQSEANVNSPSKLFRDKIGKPISEGVAVGIAQAAGQVDDALVGVIRGAKNMMQGMAQGFASEETNLYKKVDVVTGGLLTNMRKIPKGMAKEWMDEMRMEIQNSHAHIESTFRAQAMPYVMKHIGALDSGAAMEQGSEGNAKVVNELKHVNDNLDRLNKKQLTAKVSSRGIAIAAEEGRSAMGAKISKGAFSNAY